MFSNQQLKHLTTLVRWLNLCLIILTQLFTLTIWGQLTSADNPPNASSNYVSFSNLPLPKINNNQPSQLHNEPDYYKNIIIDKFSGSYKLTGKKISRFLADQNLTTTAVVVGIAPKNRMVITCKSKIDTDILKKGLQLNQNLKRFLVFVGKLTPFQKAIFLNVSEFYSSDPITAYMLNIYNFKRSIF